VRRLALLMLGWRDVGMLGSGCWDTGKLGSRDARLGAECWNWQLATGNWQLVADAGDGRRSLIYLSAKQM